MTTKFLIVNNGMTELRGHYVETGLAIAQEARNRGYVTVIASHVRFPSKEFPGDIPIYPLFRLDHWAGKVDAVKATLFDIRADLKLLREISIEAVLDGRITMREYLESRFEPLPLDVYPDPYPVPIEAPPAPSEPVPTEPLLTETQPDPVIPSIEPEPLIPETIAVPTPITPPPPKPTGRQRIKAQIKRWLPPVITFPLRWMWRQKYILRLMVRGVTPPALYNAVKARWHALRQPKIAIEPVSSLCVDETSAANIPSTSPEPVIEPLNSDSCLLADNTDLEHISPVNITNSVEITTDVVTETPDPPLAESTESLITPSTKVISFADEVDRFLKEALHRIPHGMIEYDFCEMYAQDLERFLCITDAGPGDHVFLPTAHGREAFAICRLIHKLGTENAPTFHLEFRHALATLNDLEAEAPLENQHVIRYTHVHRAFFDACRGYPETNLIHYYADTAELCEDHSVLSGYTFRELPIPFRSSLIPFVPPRSGPLTIMFLGDVRKEKGFHLLPGLVRDLYETYIRAGKVRFVIQGSLHKDETHQELQDSMVELSDYPSKQVSLPGRDGFLSAETYYQLLAEADVVLCPYDPIAYRARSSGVFAEAITAAKPTIVPADTWLAHQQLPGSGETYKDTESFTLAVQRVIDNYPSYLERAKVARDRWLNWHSTASLLSQLVGPRTAVTEAA